MSRSIGMPLKIALMDLPLQAPANKPTTERRSANYKPPLWEHDFLQSMSSQYSDERYMKTVEKMKESIRPMIQGLEPLAQLQFIDRIERLGLGYHFEKEIKGALDSIWISNNKGLDEDLHGTALRFRLLRKHGYHVSQDVFKSFMDKTSSFKEGLCMDTKGLLSLYEASYLAFSGDTILDEARDFTTTHLKNANGKIDPILSKKVEHALEVPLHWRVPRMEARWYIDTYNKEENMNSNLLDLAKLDYNVVQAMLQRELRDASRWHTDLGLCKELKFTRDRLVENYIWAVGSVFEPQFGNARIAWTKFGVLVTVIDDIYDIYGSLDELELFTDVMDRWDIGALEELPGYMKVAFLAVYNTVHQIAYETLKEHGWNIIPYLKKGWADLCKAYLVEAKWYNKRYTPTLEEYLNNAWHSITIPLLQLVVYFRLKDKITKEAIECLENNPNIIRQSALINRLLNDLATSPGEQLSDDNPKSIQCCIHESGVSETVARVHIENMIMDMWKEMNKDVVEPSLFTRPFIDSTVDIARMTHFFYQGGHADQYGKPTYGIKDCFEALMVEPIPINET